MVVLASLFCMAVRALLRLEPIGILIWPVVFGFGLDRLAAGNGVIGGTAGGLLGFLATGLVLCGVGWLTGPVSAPWPLASCALVVLAGACWGFYLSVWLYMIVETVYQLL
jgi:hypothetical protein